MAQLTELNKISIAEIVFYVPALVVAAILATRHGWGRSSGWFFLVMLSLIRILGGALQLATINNGNNISLAIAASTLTGIGLSALILVMLGLLSRVVESIRHSRSTLLLEPRHIRLVQLLVLVGLILGIVGGSKTGSNVTKALEQNSPTWEIPTESKAGLALMIAGFGILSLATLYTATQVSAAEPGEKRLLLAVALVWPFVLVRVVYAGLSTFDSSNRDFRSFNSGEHYADFLVGMAVAMEMAAVLIFEAVGLTLHRRVVGRKTEDVELDQVSQTAQSHHQQTSGIARA